MSEGGGIAGSAHYRVEIIAKLFNLTVRRIQQLTQDGVLPTVETPDGRRYDLFPTIQRYVRYLSEKAYRKERPDDGEDELRKEKLRLDIEWKKRRIQFLDRQMGSAGLAEAKEAAETGKTPDYSGLTDAQLLELLETLDGD